MVKTIASCVIINVVDHNFSVLGSIFDVYGATVIDYILASKTKQADEDSVDCSIKIGGGYIDLNKGLVVNPEQCSFKAKKRT